MHFVTKVGRGDGGRRREGGREGALWGGKNLKHEIEFISKQGGNFGPGIEYSV